MMRQRMIVSLIVFAISGTILLGSGNPPTSVYYPLVIPLNRVWISADGGDCHALFEKGIRLGGGFGCNKDPEQALEAMQASARLGYGPAVLVCAMAEEIKTGWIVVGGTANGGLVTPVKRLYA